MSSRAQVIAVIYACFLALFGHLDVAATRGAERPNIVLIFADDLGWQQPGFAGSDYCETPHLDRLAESGMIFRQAYSSGGNCAPSRACMLSGQYTPRHGVYAVGSTSRGPVDSMRMVPIKNNLSLPLKTVTLGEAMKTAGYVTGMFGKCHLNESSQGKSERSGFDVVKVSQHSYNSDDPNDPKAIFSITDAACEFFEANRDRQFFAYIPHYAVHTKLQGRDETLKHFTQKERGEHNDPLLAACLADLDTGVGMILAKLKELDLDKKTLIIFTSDNGGTAVSQEPLRGKKGSYYEGGIRVPTIASWHNVVAPGSVCDVPVTNVDFFPTFLEVAGVSNIVRGLDGTSFVPLLRGESGADWPPVFWHFPGYLSGPVPRGRDTIFRTRPVSVIRKGDWKLHLFHEEWQLDGGRDKLAVNQAVELFNIADDPGERFNLALADPGRRDELLAWFEKTDAALPTDANPSSRPSETKSQGGATRAAD